MVEDYEIQQKKKSALDLLDEAKKGKELKPVDHSTITYLPFRKNLFIIPRALSRLNEEQVKEKRDELQIKVRGKGCPPPIETWEQSGLSDRILSLLSKAKLDAPFAVQKQALPAIMCGRDVIGVAKTGSGMSKPFFRILLSNVHHNDHIQSLLLYPFSS